MTRKTVLVTGASAGIGAATARLAARDGYDVAINYRTDRDGAQGVAADVEAAGGRALLVQADVSDPAAVRAMFEAVDDAFGPLDALVNNAGIVAPLSRIEDMSENRLTGVFSVNINGTIYPSQQAIRRMSTRHGGTGGVIVNLSSAAALIGAPGQYADYAAAKAAVDTLTRSLALENAADGIRVNAVRPGVIDTAIHGKSGEPDRAKSMASNVPMQRAGTAEEVAEAILFLMSDRASYITGHVLAVTGGR